MLAGEAVDFCPALLNPPPDNADYLLLPSHGTLMPSLSPSPDQPQNALTLLTSARQAGASDGKLVDLILGGTSHLNSWLIEHRIVPALHATGNRLLRFIVKTPGHDHQAAAILPLADGSAFICNVSGLWSALEKDEAIREIQYIGFRYAPSDHWQEGFEAMLEQADGTCTPVSPTETANFWKESTGTLPHGFETGVLDQVEAFGFDVMDKFFNTQGQLGL